MFIVTFVASVVHSDSEIYSSMLQTTVQSQRDKWGAVGQHSGKKLVYIPYSCPLPGQSDVISQILYNPPVIYTSHHFLQPE